MSQEVANLVHAINVEIAFRGNVSGRNDIQQINTDLRSLSVLTLTALLELINKDD